MDTHPLTDFMSDPERRARLVAAADKAMEERITEQFKWALPDVVTEECVGFLKEHIAPEIQKHLLAQKSVILKAALKAADEIGEQVAQKLAESAGKHLASSWNVTKLVEALFK